MQITAFNHTIYQDETVPLNLFDANIFYFQLSKLQLYRCGQFTMHITYHSHTDHGIIYAQTQTVPSLAITGKEMKMMSRNKNPCQAPGDQNPNNRTFDNFIIDALVPIKVRQRLPVMLLPSNHHR
ncbi:hypothetical protein PABG_00892 [Paracoccidioides brasiliensis Pb03]|nr:hypothetical protein PABG_00892 [Paracoccidioides brasiliensis Pb03]